MNQIIRLTAILLLTVSVAQAQNFVFSPINVRHGLSDNQVRYIIQLPDGRMIFKTSSNLNVYDGTNFKYIRQSVQHVYPLQVYDGFYRIYQCGDSILWIKDYHKLMCLDLRNEKYIEHLGRKFKDMGFKHPIDDIFMDSGQRLWVLTNGILSPEDHSLKIDITAQKGRLQDLAAQKNNLYLFYNTGTVVCYDLRTKKRRYTADAYAASERSKFGATSLVVEGKNGFYQLRNGSHGGFFFFNVQSRLWKKVLETDYTLNTLIVDCYGLASVSCANGIWRINCQTGKKQYLPVLKKTDGSSLDTEISTIFSDKQDGLWLGTVNQGLLYYHPSRYSFTHVGRSHFPNISLKDFSVQSFAEDVSGYIYIKCQPGIFRYDPSAPEINLQPVNIAVLPQQVSEALNQNKINYPGGTSEIRDIRGWRWTGTGDGLKVFDPVKDRERVFYTNDGLSNNFIHAILQDRQNNIWITTSYGINKAQINSLTGKINFISFGPDAGTLEGEYTDGSAYEANNGALYFGGVNGFSILSTMQIASKKLPFPPLFTNFFLHGLPVEPGKRYDGREIMPVSAAYTTHIELSHDQNFLTFEFSALNYQNSAQTYYKYQLEGIDQDWLETKGTNGILSLPYTNLPHGKYKLKVMSSNTSQNWQGPISIVQLTIHAPWWKTTLAYIVFVSAGIILVVTAFANYMRNVRKKIERIHREDILLLRIRNLIEQQNNLQSENEISSAPDDTGTSYPERNHHQNQADSAFLARALAEVEKNLHVSNYSVEQLSRDLHMDRTGLYRKLTALMDKSPSLFIRNVRLEKAAALILEGELSISEITERVGFSTSSYLSKCFQERYGCRPSEYAEKAKKST